MLNEKIYGVYFSATGTTEKIVRTAANAAVEYLRDNGAGNGLEAAFIDFTRPGTRERELCFEAGDLVFIGLPVYAGRMPNLLLPYLREKISGINAAVVPIVLYGNRNYDDALIELKKLMEDAGFLVAAAGAFVGEHSFSYVLGAGRPDSEDLALASELGVRAAKKVKTVLPVSISEHGKINRAEAGSENHMLPVSVPGHDPVRPYYTPRDRYGNPINILSVKPKTDMKKCTRCGLCAELCPLESISAGEPAVITGICMKCGACIKKCPAQAKYFDDEGYLYHKKELEEVYSRRGKSEIFW